MTLALLVLVILGVMLMAVPAILGARSQAQTEQRLTDSGLLAEAE
ncbi:hypothetical protein [Roseateles sp. DAIF2]|nr:hypothetical protein [Roseateles sp. DAIF2]